MSSQQQSKGGSKPMQAPGGMQTQQQYLGPAGSMNGYGGQSPIGPMGTQGSGAWDPSTALPWGYGSSNPAPQRTNPQIATNAMQRPMMSGGGDPLPPNFLHGDPATMMGGVPQMGRRTGGLTPLVPEQRDPNLPNPARSFQEKWASQGFFY